MIPRSIERHAIFLVLLLECVVLAATTDGFLTSTNLGNVLRQNAFTAVLAAGMTFVIEPGIYIRERALDELPKTPANEAFVTKVRPVVQKYKDIGIRIEDSFLLTDTGLTRLSAKVPRTAAEVETFMKGR